MTGTATLRDSTYHLRTWRLRQMACALSSAARSVQEGLGLHGEASRTIRVAGVTAARRSWTLRLHALVGGGYACSCASVAAADEAVRAVTWSWRAKAVERDFRARLVTSADRNAAPRAPCGILLLAGVSPAGISLAAHSLSTAATPRILPAACAAKTRRGTTSYPTCARVRGAYFG